MALNETRGCASRTEVFSSSGQNDTTIRLVNTLKKNVVADQTKKVFDELMGEVDPNDFEDSKSTEEFKRDNFYEEESKSKYGMTQNLAQQNKERDEKVFRLESEVEKLKAELESKTRTIKNLEMYLDTQKSENDEKKIEIEELSKISAEDE